MPSHFIEIMANEKKKLLKKVEITNRRAVHEYFFEDEFESGIVLRGTEIKSIRHGTVNMNDAYCIFDNGELWVHNMYIAEYAFGTYSNHASRRPRKLLLRKQELKKLDRKVREKGHTIIPYKMFINERGFCKLKIELASGKKSYDKRSTIQARDEKRDLDRLRKIKL